MEYDYTSKLFLHRLRNNEAGGGRDKVLPSPEATASFPRFCYEAFDSATILEGAAGVLSIYPTPRTV
jgi:hypothetical protein